MPLTPVTWLDEGTIGNVNTVTTGAQFDPDITQLANGNILVSWTSSQNTGAGSPPLNDVIAQIFDPLGNRIGGEIRLNTDSTEQTEQDVDLVALPGGGFMAVYEDDESSVASGFGIRVEVYSASGTPTGGASVEGDAANAVPNFFDPQIAAASATSSLIVYREAEAGGADNAIVGRLFNPTTNTVGAVISLINFPGDNLEPDVTALSNGNYAIVCQTFDPGGAGNEISLRIVNQAGGNVLAVTTIGGAGSASNSNSDPSITALTGGGFVVTWAQFDGIDTDTFFQVFNNAGASVSVPTFVNGGSGNNSNNEGVVIPLTDGGFAIIYDNDEVGQLQVQRFSNVGAAIGVAFTISVGAGVTEPSATLLDDGRFAVTFLRNSGEIGMEILDIRDVVNAPVYTPDTHQVGTIGSDSFTASGEIVHGHTGNDTIVDGGGINAIFGDAGNDDININAVDATESYNGGADTDTLRGTNVAAGTVYDLAAGTVTSGATTVSATNFENVVGSAVGETIIGTAGINVLSGGGGTDFIIGGAGADTLNGDADPDILFFGPGADIHNGGGGIDYVTYAAGPIQPTGTNTMRIDLVTPAINSGLAAGDTFNSIEAFFLSQGDDLFSGDNANNFVYGQAGNDAIAGGGGGDILFAEGGNDFINSGALSDILVGGTGFDTFYYSINQVEQDQILDFSSADDTIALDDVGFNLVGQTIQQGVNFIVTTMAQGAFYAAGQSTLIFFSDIDQLYADTDGAGGAAANLLAVFAGNPTLTASDFAIL